MSTATESGTTKRTTEEWVEAFAEGWRAPTDADAFCNHFDALIDDRVRLIQPQLPDLVGKREFRERFARPLFSLLSDVRGTVESWAMRDELAFIELTIRGRVGGRQVEMRTIDKVTIRDGLAVERVASLDPSPLLAAVALAPRAWPAFARVQLERLHVTAAIRGAGR
jgi:SnoaL-like domain